MSFHHNQVLPRHRLEIPDRQIHFFIHYDARPIAAHSCFRIGIKDFEIRIEIPGGTTRTIKSIPVASSRKILVEHRLPNVVVRSLHEGPIQFILRLTLLKNTDFYPFRSRCKKSKRGAILFHNRAERLIRFETEKEWAGVKIRFVRVQLSVIDKRVVF